MRQAPQQMGTLRFPESKLLEDAFLSHLAFAMGGNVVLTEASRTAKNIFSWTGRKGKRSLSCVSGPGRKPLADGTSSLRGL